jgi:hypothetical protein
MIFFSKNNCLRRRRNRWKTIIPAEYFSSKVWALFIITQLFLFFADNSSAQEAKVNQRKIERERAKKQKQAVRDYEKAVKRHQKMQSKSTKASMKKSKKEAPKLTPVGR